MLTFRWGLFLLGFVLLALLAACDNPVQPDLNTYGNIQPVCVLFCTMTSAVTEGDAASGGVTSSQTQTGSYTRN